jgi:Ca-activated chloride channel family protein
MKKLFVFIPILLLAVIALAGCGQSAETLNNKGNEAFAEQDYEGALTAYLGAQEDVPEMAEPHYNAANSHYRMEDYQQAQQEIEQALVGEESQQALDQHSYYNLGNTFFQAQQFEPAIEAYKEALRLNPDDLQAKQNLELALRQLQQQQEQQQQEQADPWSANQQQSDDQSADQQSEDEQQQEQQSADQQQSDDQSEQDQADEPSDEGQPQQIEGLTEEQARQLLEAAAEGAESLEEFLQQILIVPGGSPLEDW